MGEPQSTCGSTGSRSSTRACHFTNSARSTSSTFWRLLSHQVPEAPCQAIHQRLHSHQVLWALPHPPLLHSPPQASRQTVLDEEGASAGSSSCTTVGGADVGPGPALQHPLSG
jgi:hypothetical protein